MNIRFYNIYGLVSLFPIWIFRGNLGFIDISILFSLFLLVPFLLHFGFLTFLIKKKKDYLIYIWFAFISFYSIDQNLGLWLFSGNITKIFNAGTPYLNSLAFITFNFSLLIFFTIKKMDLKFFSFVFVVFIFNLLDTTKNFSKFPSINVNKEIKDIELSKNNKKLIIFFDEMSGFNSEDNNVKNASNYNNLILDFYTQNNFNIYTNAYSLFFSTDKVMSSLLNFITDIKTMKI